MANKMTRDYTKDKGKFSLCFDKFFMQRNEIVYINCLILIAFDNVNPLNLTNIYILEQMKTFFLEFVAMDDTTGNKIFKYRQMLTKIAHREQISFEIDLDDVQSFDEDLAMSIANNTRRYTNLVLNVCLYNIRKFVFVIQTYNCINSNATKSSNKFVCINCL